MENRRSGRQQVLVLFGMPDHLVEHFQIRLPIRRYRFHEREEVRDSYIINSGGVKLGCVNEPRECRITTVAAAVNSDALGIRDSFFDEPLDTVADVVLHRLAPLLEARLPKLAAVSGRAAEVDLQHCVTSIRQKLHFRIEAPRVAIPWTTMRIHDDRQIA